jgi:hypothetical protein
MSTLALIGKSHSRVGISSSREKVDELVIQEYCSGELELQDTWEGNLPAGDYQIEWGAPFYGGTYTTLTVVINQNRLSIMNYASTLDPKFGLE